MFRKDIDRIVMMVWGLLMVTLCGLLWLYQAPHIRAGWAAWERMGQ